MWEINVSVHFVLDLKLSTETGASTMIMKQTTPLDEYANPNSDTCPAIDEPVNAVNYAEPYISRS